MSDAITRVGPRTAVAPAVVKDARTEKLEKAAGEFESLFVKQLLKEAKIGGAQKSSGYADMAVDALANGIQRGGGLGLAKRIEQALNAAHAHPAPAVAGATATPLTHGVPPTPQPATRGTKR
jgi:Rod binding domain-containing protein